MTKAELEMFVYLTMLVELESVEDAIEMARYRMEVQGSGIKVYKIMLDLVDSDLDPRQIHFDFLEEFTRHD